MFGILDQNLYYKPEMKQKILVTGGAGFIGSNFCNINQDKFEVIALDNLFLGDPDNLDEGIRFINGDAGKLEDLEKCGDQFDAVLHLAGTSSAPMFSGDGYVDGYMNSVESFLRSIEFARKTGAKKFLYASTSSIYGNQELPLREDKPVSATNHYSASKLFYENAAEAYTQNYPELETIGFRFMSVYGPNEEAKGEYANLISQFIWDLQRGTAPIVYGDGTQTRDFTNVADIVQGITKAIETDTPLGNTVFNIGRGEGTSLNDMLEMIEKYMQTGIEPQYIENPVKENYIAAQHADITRIVDILGFQPTITLEEGIKQQVEQLRPEKIRKTSSDALR